MNKKMDNQENNYADNEGSKSMSSINLKSSTAGSNLKQPKKNESKMFSGFDEEENKVQQHHKQSNVSNTFSNINN